MQRIVVIGTTGSGKSTLAQALARRLDLAVIEPDALHWAANWQEVPTEVFRQRVDDATRAERWVFGGNYSKARDLVWTRADTLVWLDYSLALVLRRLLGRTVARIVSREDLWGSGSRETWRTQFLSRDSLFVWAIKTHGRYQNLMDTTLRQPEYAHLRVLRFTSPRQADRWLAEIQ